MNVYKITTEEDTFVVFAGTKEKAIDIIIDNYFDGEGDVDIIEEVEVEVIKEGLIIHYDAEDFYFGY